MPSPEPGADMRRRDFWLFSVVRRPRGRSRRVRSRTEECHPSVSWGRVPRQLDKRTRRIRAPAARTRLGRWQHCRDRVSLVEGHNERAAEIAAEFVRLKVDVIVTASTAAVQAAKAALLQ